MGDVFDREIVEIRRRFQEMVTNEDFANGLLLSSRTLDRSRHRYVRSPAEKAKSKTRQVERSLMRYYSRAAMKATPFSTFCALVPGTFDSGSDAGTSEAEASLRGDPARKRTVPRINKSLYARLLGHLLRRDAVRRAFHVELNPTLREEGENRWLFLLATGGKEIFQRLARNEILEELCRRLESGPATLAELIDALVSDPEIEAEPDEAAAYLDRLLAIGFLRVRVGIREQEVDWDRPLAELLAQIDDEHADAIHDFLGRLRANLEDYVAAKGERRREILDATATDLAALEERLDAELLEKRKPIFYEDAGGEASLHLDLGDLEGILVEYVDLVSRIAWPRAEQAGMRRFFDLYYGDEASAVPLLRFYEDYYREHFKQHLEREQQKEAAERATPSAVDGETDTKTEEVHEEEAHEEAESYDLDNPFDLDLVRAIETARNGFTERLQALWRAAPEAEEIRLEREDLEALLAPVPTEGTTCRSASLFVQWVPGAREGERDTLVAQSTLVGFGKYFSRFLSVLPDDVRRDLIENNRHLTAEDLAEICGDGAHNANLHPPLLPREISYPAGESGQAEEQIPSARIVVARDPRDEHRLCLRDAETGTGIVPVDLGFLNPRLRPPLYRLLSRFTPVANFHLVVPGSASADANPAEASETPSGDELRDRPRITYRGRLILSRRQWRIAFEDFPDRAKKESEADYFLRVQDWRLARGLPDDVFLRILPLPGAKGGSRRRMREHLYKPQYVDFRNPLLVDLFSRATENLENAILLFEERLPRADQLLEGAGERWVSELVVQVDFAEGDVDA